MKRVPCPYCGYMMLEAFNFCPNCPMGIEWRDKSDPKSFAGMERRDAIDGLSPDDREIRQRREEERIRKAGGRL